MDDDTGHRHEDWSEKIRSHAVEDKLRLADRLGLAEHLWNEYQYRHDLVWNLVFRLTAAVVVLAIIPYTQDKIMIEIGRWILAPAILGVALAIVGLSRVDREVRQLNHVRNLYRPLQDSLFYDFHGDKESWFGAFVRTYISFLILLALINILFISNCWIPEEPCRTIGSALNVL